MNRPRVHMRDEATPRFVVCGRRAEAPLSATQVWRDVTCFSCKAAVRRNPAYFGLPSYVSIRKGWL